MSQACCDFSKYRALPQHRPPFTCARAREVCRTAIGPAHPRSVGSEPGGRMWQHSGTGKNHPGKARRGRSLPGPCGAGVRADLRAARCRDPPHRSNRLVSARRLPIELIHLDMVVSSSGRDGRRRAVWERSQIAGARGRSARHGWQLGQVKCSCVGCIRDRGWSARAARWRRRRRRRRNSYLRRSSSGPTARRRRHLRRAVM